MQVKNYVEIAGASNSVTFGKQIMWRLDTTTCIHILVASVKHYFPIWLTWVCKSLNAMKRGKERHHSFKASIATGL